AVEATLKKAGVGAKIIGQILLPVGVQSVVAVLFLFGVLRILGNHEVSPAHGGFLALYLVMWMLLFAVPPRDGQSLSNRRWRQILHLSNRLVVYSTMLAFFAFVRGPVSVWVPIAVVALPPLVVLSAWDV